MGLLRKIFSTKFTQTWYNWLAALTILYAAIPNRVTAHIRYGIDPAWQYALNTAIEHKYVFGQDWVFTYGPLGYLSTAWPPNQALAWVLLYKLLLYAGLCGLGIFNYFSSTHWIQKAVTVLVFVIAGRLYYYESSVYFLVLFIAALIWHKNTRSNYLLLLISAFVAINLFIKLNTAFVVAFCFVAYLLFALTTKAISMRILLICIALTGTMVVALAFATHTHLASYLIHGLAIVKHYQDAMVIDVIVTSAPFVLAILLAVLIGLLLIANILIYKNYATIPLSLLLSGVLFIAFKQGFVAGAGNHQIAYFGAGLMMLLAIPQLSQHFMQWLINKIVYPSAALVATIGIMHIGVFGFFNRPLKDLYAKEPIAIYPFPDSILAKTAKQTIDIFPCNAMHLYFNQLNYQPRPIPQGYQAYSPTLDSLNTIYFQSANAPEILLFQQGSVFNRHPFWDELNTKLTIRENYQLNDSVWLANLPGTPPSRYWLLQKNEQPPRRLTYQLMGTAQAAITDTLFFNILPENYLTRIYLHYSWPGKIRRLLFQPALLDCHLVYQNGSTQTFKAVLPTLQGGYICP